MLGGCYVEAIGRLTRKQGILYDYLGYIFGFFCFVLSWKVGTNVWKAVKSQPLWLTVMGLLSSFLD